MAENWMELSENNIGLVYHIAARHKKKLGKYSIYEFEDLVAEGNLALVKAAQNFDTNNGASFSSYACVCIDGAIKQFINRVTPVVSFNCRASEISSMIVTDGNEYDSVDEIMKKYNVIRSVAGAAKLYILNKYYASLNEKVTHDEEDADDLMDLVTQHREDYVFHVSFQKFYNRLTEKEKRIVIGRMIGESHKEIGDSMGVSREAVRARIKKIRKKYDNSFVSEGDKRGKKH
jgi:RNA polymerase sigma factor (sigma-70 family)